MNSELFFHKNESQKIINYIIKNNLYVYLQGNEVWQKIENFQICPGKSWMSIKHHFHALVVNSFNSINISNDEKTKLIHCSNNSSIPENDYNYNRNSSDLKKLSHDSNRNKISLHEDKKEKKKIISTNQDENLIKKMKDEGFVEKKYCYREDKIIIKFLRENVSCNETYSDKIYQNCQKQLQNRSVHSIKNRFICYILPNLYKFKIVDLDEISYFYDKAGMDIPPDIEQIINNLMEGYDSVKSSDRRKWKSIHLPIKFKKKNMEYYKHNKNVDKICKCCLIKNKMPTQQEKLITSDISSEIELIEINTNKQVVDDNFIAENPSFVTKELDQFKIENNKMCSFNEEDNRILNEILRINSDVEEEEKICKSSLIKNKRPTQHEKLTTSDIVINKELFKIENNKMCSIKEEDNIILNELLGINTDVEEDNSDRSVEEHDI